MELTISLDNSDPLLISQQQIEGCIYSIIFIITVDQLFEQKMQRIGNYIDLLTRYPTIKTTIKLNEIQNSKLKSFNVVAVGGTFDYLHIGHQILLLYTVLTARQTVYIGVTGDNLLINKKYKEVLQSLQERMRRVEEFVKSINPNLNYVIFQLNDPYGPTINDTLNKVKIQKSIQCLITSPETSSAITKINSHRQALQLHPLQLTICPLLSTNHALDTKISSSTIRKYFVDKNQMDKQELAKYKGYFINLTKRMSDWKKQEKYASNFVQKWWSCIFQNYSQYWRFYHTNRHIYDLLTKWKSQEYTKFRQQLTQKQIVILQISIFLHDIIYYPNSKTNQKDSSILAEKFLLQFQGEYLKETDIIQQVKILILQTQNHEPTSNISAILYDLDMGILNDPQNYKKYAQNIRNQFFPIYKENYAKGRIQFLTKTLNSKLRFSFEPKYLKQNLTWEIDFLKVDNQI